MKKKIILFILLLIIPFIVYAEEGPFSKVFTAEEVAYSFDMVDYNNGYAFLDSLEDGYHLRYYDGKGELKKDITYDSQTMAYTIFNLNDNLYVILNKYNDGNYVVSYDKDLNQIKEFKFADYFYPPTIYMSSLPMAAVLHIKYKENVIIKDNKIHLPDWQMNVIYVLPADLSSKEEISFTEDEKDSYLEEYYPVYAKLLNIMDLDPEFESSLTLNFSTPVIFNDNYILVSKTLQTCPDNKIAEPYQEMDKLRKYFEECHTSTLNLYDKDYNLLWSKEMNDKTYTILYTEFLDNYILVSLIEKDNNVLQVYDLEGNLIQEFATDNVGEVYGSITKTKNGFSTTISNLNVLKNITVIFADGEPIEHNEVYIFSNPIEKETDGHGSINVKTRAFPGETVEIEVEPANGFVLGELKVVDEDGNEIAVEGNRFIMANKKVTVIANFVTGNPNTNTQSILFISILAIICGLVFISQKRKLNFLK
jgi:hypothetical protein